MGYCIEHLPSRLSIGRETETGVTDIRIDCTDWLERWPGMTVAAIFCPPGGTPYIVDAEMSGNSLVWHVRNTDTATPGIGQLELTGEADGKRKLSALVDVQVARRLPGTAGDAPDPAKPWVDSVLGAAERITGMQVAAVTLDAGSAASAQWDGKTGLLTLGIPRGPVGPQGEKGDTGGVGPAGSDGITPAISVGTVTTLEAGSQATVARRGTDDAPIFDFGIPRGEDGGSGSEIPKPLTYDYMPEGYPSKSIQHAVQMEEQQLTFIVDQGVAQAQSPVVFNLSDFLSVIVEWDGVVYTCSVKEVNKTLIFGNLGLLGLEDTTNEPFVYFNGFWGTSDTAASHTIKVTSANYTYSTMSSDFLPLVNGTNRGAVEVINFDAVDVRVEQFEDAIGKLNAGQARVFWRGVEIIAGSCKTSGTIRIIFANKPCVVRTFTANDGVYNSTLGKFLDRENTNLGVFSELYLHTNANDKIFRITVDDSGTLSATEVTN